MLLMNSTVMSDIEPESKQFTLCIEFGVEKEYKFLLEDGSTRRARLNEFEPFAGIRDYAAVSVFVGFHSQATIGCRQECLLLLCGNLVPLLTVSPRNYDYKSDVLPILIVSVRCFLSESPSPPSPHRPHPISSRQSNSTSVGSLPPSLDRSGDLFLGYHALTYFLQTPSADYLHLTDLSLILARSLATASSVLPSKMDYLLIYAAYSTLHDHIGIDFFRSPRERHPPLLFVETLFRCLHNLLLRCGRFTPLSSSHQSPSAYPRGFPHLSPAAAPVRRRHRLPAGNRDQLIAVAFARRRRP